jgi:hypothetical protein
MMAILNFLRVPAARLLLDECEFREQQQHRILKGTLY